MTGYGFGEKYEGWTERWRRIVQMIGEDYSDEEMARDLYVTANTIRTYITQIGDAVFGDGLTGPRRRTMLRRLFVEYQAQLQDALTIVEEFTDVVWNPLFVYGSLLDSASLRRSLANPQRNIECIPAFLENHSINWGLPSWRPLIDHEGASVNDLYLEWLTVDYTPETTGSVPGALINVTDGDLQRLRWRERSYAEVDVTADIRLASEKSLPVGQRVVTFRSPREEPRPMPAGYRTAVRKGYHDAITNALARVHRPEVALPEPNRIEDVFYADPFSVTAWKARSLEEILTWEQNLRRTLQEADCTRRITDDQVDLIPYVLRPLVITGGVWEQVNLVSETAVSLCSKALAVLLDDRHLQRAAGYNDNDTRLARASLANNFSGRDTRCPNLPEICRVDLTLTDRGHLHVLELNTDSPAGTFNLDVLIPVQLEQCRSMGMSYLPREWPGRACESLIRALELHWNGYLAATGASSRPLRSVAILDVDVRNRPTSSEFREFQRRFEEAGIEAKILEPDEITYRDGKLLRVEDGVQIDLVYKRLLFDDIMRERNFPSATARGAGIGALERAYSDNAVCMAPTMLSRMVGNKFLFALIKHPTFEKRLGDLGLELTGNEQRVRRLNIPETHVWAAGTLQSEPGLHHSILEDAKSWVLKAVNSFGSNDVHFGNSLERPRSVFLDKYNHDYIAQREQPHGVMEVPVTVGRRIYWEFKPFTLGCYVFRGSDKPRAMALEAKVAASPPVALNVPGGGRTAVFPTVPRRSA